MDILLGYILLVIALRLAVTCELFNYCRSLHLHNLSNVSFRINILL